MTAPSDCDLIVSGGVVITLDADRRVLADGAVAIQAGRIVAVGPAAVVAAAWNAPSLIDAAGGLIHPGYIDGHYHAGLHLIRGALPDDPGALTADPARPGAFARWLNALTEKDEHAAATLMACEMAMNGFTGFVEAATAFFPDVVAEEASTVGIRSSVSDCMLWDLVVGDEVAVQIPRAPCDLDHALAGLGGQLHRNAAGGLSRGHVAIYGMATGSDVLMAESKRLADAAGSVVHQHQSFMAEDAAVDALRSGKPAMVHYLEHGLIGPSSVFTHMNVLSEAEVEAIVASGMALVWHPCNAGYYGVTRKSPSRFPVLHRAGTQIAFGTDVAKAWSFGDLGPIGYLMSREQGDYLPAEAILEMQTLGGARAMGMADHLGCLAVGRAADVVIRDAALPQTSPGFDPVGHLMLIQRTKGVRTVLCNGQVIVENGLPTRVDLLRVLADARVSAHETASRADLAPAPRWTIQT